MHFSFNNVSIVTHMQNILHYLNVLLISSETTSTSAIYLFQNPTIVDSNFTNFTHVQVLGQYLYSTGGVLLIVTSVILLLAMVASIFITKKAQSN